MSQPSSVQGYLRGLDDIGDETSTWFGCADGLDSIESCVDVTEDGDCDAACAKLRPDAIEC